MAQDLELALRIRADLKQAVKEIRSARDEIKGFGAAGKGAKAGLRGMTSEVDRAESRLRRLHTAASGMRSMLVSLGAALSFRAAVRTVVDVTDAYKRMEGQLRLVTSSEEGLARAQRDLFTLAQSTRSEYDSTVSLYARMARNADNLGLSQQQLLDITKATNQAVQVSGASSQEAAAGVLQFSQALASGELRGDEFRSVMENMPRLAKAIADGMKLNVGELRKAAEDGALTAESVTQALLSQTGVIESEFQQLPRTVGQALTQLDNEFRRSLSGTEMDPLLDGIDALKEAVTDPEIRQGLVILGAAAAQTMGALAKTGAALAQAMTRIGEAFGELAAGVGGSKRSIENHISGLQSRIAVLDEDLDRPRLLRVNPFVSTESMQQERERLQQEIELWQSQLALWAQPGNRGNASATQSPPPGGAPAAGGTPTETAPSKDFLAAQADLERRIALLGQEGVAQQMLWEVEQGRYSGLEAGEKAALVALARRLDAGQAGIRQAEEQARALEEARAEQVAYDAELEQAARALRDVLDPVEPLRRELAQLDELLARGALSWDEWAEGTLRVHERMDELNGVLDDAAAEASEFALQAARGIQDVMTDYLFDPFDEGVDGMLQGFADMVRRMIAEALAAKLAEKLFGDFSSTGELGGWIGSLMGSLFHAGGVAGEAAPGRSLPELAYLGAPRYHGGGIAGLAPDEIPAILRRGEEVLTADDPRHVANGGASAAAPQTLQVAVHPDALRMTLGEWLEGELARVVATR